MPKWLYGGKTGRQRKTRGGFCRGRKLLKKRRGILQDAGRAARRSHVKIEETDP